MTSRDWQFRSEGNCPALKDLEQLAAIIVVHRSYKSTPYKPSSVSLRSILPRTNIRGTCMWVVRLYWKAEDFIASDGVVSYWNSPVGPDLPATTTTESLAWRHFAQDISSFALCDCLHPPPLAQFSAWSILFSISSRLPDHNFFLLLLPKETTDFFRVRKTLPAPPRWEQTSEGNRDFITASLQATAILQRINNLFVRRQARLLIPSRTTLFGLTSLSTPHPPNRPRQK